MRMRRKTAEGPVVIWVRCHRVMVGPPDLFLPASTDVACMWSGPLRYLHPGLGGGVAHRMRVIGVEGDVRAA